MALNDLENCDGLCGVWIEFKSLKSEKSKTKSIKTRSKNKKKG